MKNWEITLAYLNKTTASLILFLSTLLSISAYAETRLELGEGIRLIAVNGEEINADSLFSGTTYTKLKPGLNQVVVNYTAEIKPGDDSELEVTQPSVLLFKTNTSVINLIAPKMKSLADVEKFEKNLNWTLIDQNGKAIPFKVSLLVKKGFQLSRDYEDELEEFNMSNANAALPKTRILSPQEVKTTNKQSQVMENKNMAMEMLIYWYNQADEKTRRSFKELISK